MEDTTRTFSVLEHDVAFCLDMLTVISSFPPVVSISGASAVVYITLEIRHCSKELHLYGNWY